jgi:hypothetical protein
MSDKDAVLLPVVASSDELPIASNSVWKRFIVVGASAENETKRAMQGRHLMMIGE